MLHVLNERQGYYKLVTLKPALTTHRPRPSETVRYLGNKTPSHCMSENPSFTIVVSSRNNEHASDMSELLNLFQLHEIHLNKMHFLLKL